MTTQHSITPGPVGVDRGDESGDGVALELRNVVAGYGATRVIRDVSFQVPSGHVVALLGANGAGKTTLLKVASGLLRPSSGTVLLNGHDVTRAAPHTRARQGLCLIPEGRGIFRSLTVRDNLRIQLPPWSSDSDRLEEALQLFPDLKPRLKQIAGTMSGGQQQMLALSRAWIAYPSVVLLDEVSMGLSPKLVDTIFESLRALAARHVTLLLVEQYVTRALEVADGVVLLERGRISYAGSPTGLDDAVLASGYLGVPDAAK